MRLTTVMALCAIVFALFSPPALAGELEELKAQIQLLMQRVEELERQRQTEPQAPAQTAAPTKPANALVTAGNPSVRLSVSGQVNRALLAVDDGASADLHHVDNDASSTRFRLIGEADPQPGLTVGAAMEVQFESNSSADVSQFTGNDATSEAGKDNFTQRRLEFYVEDKAWGKVSLGQGSTASDGTAEVDLSGTALAGYSDTNVMLGSMIFRDRVSGTLSGNPDTGDVFSNLDGQGRLDRIRYDTPQFSGAQVSLGHFQGDGWDLALRYKARLGNHRLSSALAYSEAPNSETEQVNGSFSILLDSGFSITLAAGEQDRAIGADPRFIYGKLGYQAGWNRLGTTALSVDYQQTRDKDAAEDKAAAYGLQLVQNIDDWSTEGYIGWRTFSLDRPGRSFDDITALMAGARFKF